MNTTLVTLLLFDGGIHLFLGPAHLAESRLLGASFLLCGLLQCLLGGLVLREPPAWSVALVGVVSIASLAAYGLAVTSGLPALPDQITMPGMAMPEAVSPLGLVSKLAEVATLALISPVQGVSCVRRRVAQLSPPR